MPTAREQQIDAATTAYLENADYAEVNSPVKAAAFATACRKLLFLLPKRTAQGGGTELELDPESLRGELAAALNYAASGTGQYLHPSFEGYRD